MNIQTLLKDPRTNWKYILIVVVLAFLAGGGILVYQYWWLPKTEIPVSTLIFDKTANWKTYRNEEYGFEIKYSPDRWEISLPEFHLSDPGKTIEIISLLDQKKPNPFYPREPEEFIDFHPSLEIMIPNKERIEGYIKPLQSTPPIDTQEIGRRQYNIYGTFDVRRFGYEYIEIPYEVIFIQHQKIIIEVSYDKYAKKFVQPLIESITLY